MSSSLLKKGDWLCICPWSLRAMKLCRLFDLFMLSNDMALEAPIQLCTYRGKLSKIEGSCYLYESEVYSSVLRSLHTACVLLIAHMVIRSCDNIISLLLLLCSGRFVGHETPGWDTWHRQSKACGYRTLYVIISSFSTSFLFSHIFFEPNFFL
jgi:hypothetical protein